MTNRVAELLGVEKPVIQAAMAYLTNAELVAAVSNAGGFGVLAMVAPGQDHYAPDVATRIKELRAEVKKTKALTDKPFGLNVSPFGQKKSDVDAASSASQSKSVSLTDQAKMGANDTGDDVEYDISVDQMTVGILQVAIDEGIKVVIASGVLIPEWIDKFHENGIKYIFRPATPRPKIIQEAVKAGVDAIIATGFDEGGTVPANVVGTLPTIPLVKDYAGDVPVIAAGGIADERTAKAVKDLGAEGIYAGTAFLASKEAPMADNIKQKMLDTTAEEMVMFRAPNSFYRSLPGELPNKLVQMDKDGATADEIWTASGNYDNLRQGMLLGNLSKGIASFGLGITFIHAIEPAAKIVDRLSHGFNA
ncbi:MULTISPECIES: nitronate monooxygenase family protein [Lactobacillus]|nr:MULTISPECIES: nitronate monooxygenase [Lactobacillus]